MSVKTDLISENLYLAVNGQWLEEAEIPSDKPSTSAFQILSEGVEELLMGKMRAWEAGEEEVQSEEMKEMVKLYRLALDFERRNKEGGQPLEKYLGALDKVDSLSDLNSLLSDFYLLGLPLPFIFGVDPDMKDTDKHKVYLDVPSMILPDKTYYENDQGDQLLQVYQGMMSQLMDGIGIGDGDRIIKEALEVDRLFMEHQKTSEELADYTKMYNPRTMEEVAEFSKYVDVAGIIKGLISDDVDEVIVTQPKFFENYNESLEAAGLDRLVSWLKVALVNTLAPYLSEDMRQTAATYSLALSGAEEAPSQEKHAYQVAYNTFSEVVGVYYGKNYFGPEAKADVEHMVHEMIEVYKDRLEKNDWLSQETIDKAIVKLNHLDVLVGYPEDWKAYYSRLKVDPEASLVDNVLASNQVYRTYELSKWQEPVDHSEWGMPASMVNAYFSPTNNHICFPAAILQYPFYDKDRDSSSNYGGIGAVIAHEISHAFDNNGAKFDEKGNLNNWWLEEDYAIFEEKQKLMIDQWEGIETEAGPVNGKLTVSENIADLGGLTCALEAAKGEEDYLADEFFYSWARIWANKSSEEYKQLLLAVDVHAPAPLRANMPPQNLDDFYETFDIQPGDPMFMDPEDRIVIW